MVRNFWIEAAIDGRKTPLRGGPRAGGFRLTVYMRKAGHITAPLYIEGRSVGERLILMVEIEGQPLTRIETER